MWEYLWSSPCYFLWGNFLNYLYYNFHILYWCSYCWNNYSSYFSPHDHIAVLPEEVYTFLYFITWLNREKLSYCIKLMDQPQLKYVLYFSSSWKERYYLFILPYYILFVVMVICTFFYCSFVVYSKILSVLWKLTLGYWSRVLIS